MTSARICKFCGGPSPVHLVCSEDCGTKFAARAVVHASALRSELDSERERRRLAEARLERLSRPWERVAIVAAGLVGVAFDAAERGAAFLERLDRLVYWARGR